MVTENIGTLFGYKRKWQREPVANTSARWSKDRRPEFDKLAALQTLPNS
jgi:hypothetical protein